MAGHRLREIPKADRLNFKIVPNRHQATDFLSNKDRIIQTNKVWYERDWFWVGGGGVFQVIDMSTQFSWRRCYFINARISKLESNCDEAKLKIFSCCTCWGFCCTLMRQCNILQYFVRYNKTNMTSLCGVHHTGYTTQGCHICIIIHPNQT